MKLEAIVKLGDGAAHYLISREGRGCYKAELVNYSGETYNNVPNELILLRGYRNWTGSTSNQQLLNELGEAIDSVVSGAPIFRKDSEPERNPDKTKSPEQ